MIVTETKGTFQFVFGHLYSDHYNIRIEETTDNKLQVVNIWDQEIRSYFDFQSIQDHLILHDKAMEFIEKNPEIHDGNNYNRIIITDSRNHRTHYFITHSFWDIVALAQEFKL